MNVDLGIWARLTKLILFLLFLAAVLGVGLWYFPLIQQNERMRKEILRLDQQIRLEEIKSRQLEQSFHALRNDPKAVERLAREKLGYAKPGETVILFETTEPSFP
jgi:cell division protein FtsB